MQGFKRRFLCYMSLTRGFMKAYWFVRCNLRRRRFALDAPSTRVKRGRIRRSDIGVFLERSFVLYVPSTRVHESVPVRPARLSKEDCLWERTGSSGLTPKREFA